MIFDIYSAIHLYNSKGTLQLFFKVFLSSVNTPGTAEGEGLVGPRPHHFFASPPPLFALKRKIMKIKKRLETSFFRLYSAIFSVFSLISNARHFVGLLCSSR